MAAPTVIPQVGAIKSFVGHTLGTSEWIAITQDRIDSFARATDDYQWIHCDVERARRESPFGTTIAHGYLTISLVPALLSSLVRVDGCTTVINTGIEKMRLSTPVPSGCRVRMTATLKDARDVPRGGVRATFGIRLEVEGEKKPACNANVVYVYFP